MTVGQNDLGGTVSGAGGPEAGVWVIAETTDLPTKFAKIVVTDDQGRYLIPDLPKANYRVWVRGFGLVDSAKTQATPGSVLDLKAVAAPSEKDAAQYYPAMYWYALVNVPAKSEFPMEKIKSQGEWLNIIKTGACNSCHGLGTPGMRTISPELGQFQSSAEAWTRRLMSGGAQMFMIRDITRLDTPRAIAMFADWTDRVAAGELPFDKPARPQGVERNVVVSLWDWGSPTTYLHDAVSTDRRNPRVNANGKIYGTAEDSQDVIPVLDPVTHTASVLQHPVRDPNTPSSKGNAMAPSPYWGGDPIWDSKTLNHNPMLDEKGRVWSTPRIRPVANPDYCKQGSSHPSAQIVPIETGGRNLSYYDPATGKFTLIDTCFATHHLNFALGCQPDAVDQRRGRRAGRDRMAEPQDVRGDRRRGEVAGLVAVHSRYQQQRQARRLCRSQPAGRSGQGQADRGESLRGRRQSVRTARSGAPCWAIRAASCASFRAMIRRIPP